MENKIIKLDLTLTQTYSLYALESSRENFIYDTEKFLDHNIDLKSTKEFIKNLTLESSSVDLTFNKEINDDSIRDPIYCLISNSLPYRLRGRFHTFSEALEHLKQGGKISRQFWGNNNAAGHVSLTKDGRALTDNGVSYYFSANDILATDWIFKG